MAYRYEASQLFTDISLALCVHENAASGLKEQFALRGFRYFKLDASRIADAASLFRELVTAMPCDPEYYDYHDREEVNWAALEDSLFGGLAMENSDVTLFCHSADQLVDRHLNLIFLAVETLFSIGRTRNFAVKILFFGRGPNFHPQDVSFAR